MISNPSPEEETQVQKDYHIALALQLQECANSLAETEDELEQSNPKQLN